MTTEVRRGIGLLLGAGASKPLNLPTMVDFLPEDFRRSLEDDVQIMYDVVLNWTLSQGSGEPDFELIYTATDGLTILQPEDPASIAFARHHGEGGFVFANKLKRQEVSVDWAQRTAHRLLEILRETVHHRVSSVVPKAAADLYAPLFNKVFGFSEGVRELHCFTTNYDQAIEAVWRAKLKGRIDNEPSLVRGFSILDEARGLEFDPGSYDTYGPDGPEWVVKLYKLHGSLDWIRQDGRIFESPTDDYLKKNALIYPLRKPDLEEPFRTLFSIFEQVLRQLDLLIVIGASLRDEHIRKALKTAMGADSRFKVVIHDPSADAIADSFGTEYNESVFAVPGYFGTDDGKQRLRDGLLAASTYGSTL
jgi:hypothetical protein